MPDVQPLANYSANPTGIGAAVFDPVKNPLDVELENLKSGDEGYQQALKVAADRKAKSAAALSDLSPNLNGILDSDAPYFQGESQKLFQLAQQGVKSGKSLDDVSNPMYWQMQQAKNKLYSEVQASVNQKQNLAEIYKRFDPTKHDADYFDQYIAKYRTQANPTLRSQMDIEGALRSTPPNVLKQLDDEIGKVKDSEQLVGDTKLPTGRFATVYNKGADQEKVESIVNEVYSNPKNRLGLQQLWESATPAQKSAASLSAAVETQQNKAQGINSAGDPMKYLLMSQGKQRAGQQQKEYKNVAQDASIISAAKYDREHPSDDNTWKKRYGLATGNPDAYDKELPVTSLLANAIPSSIPTFGGNINATAQPEHYSDYDAGTSIGNFAMDVPKVEQGQVVNDASGEPIMTKVMGVPNTIVAHRTFDGKPYIQTTQSRYAYSRDSKKDMNDIPDEEFLNNKGAWFPESAATPRQIINAKTDKEKEELRKQHNDFVERQNAWDASGGVDANKAAGGSATKKAATPKTGAYTNLTKVTDAKGKQFTVGFKGDDWYNVETGEIYK